MQFTQKIDSAFFVQSESAISINSRNRKESKIWDKPVLCEEPVSDDVVSYIMSGKLREACETELTLTDALMKEINIDVHNRVYTLIENGLLI